MAAEQYCLAQDPSDQYEALQNKDFDIKAIDLGTDMTLDQWKAIMQLLRKYRDVFPSRNRPLG